MSQEEKLGTVPGGDSGVKRVPVPDEDGSARQVSVPGSEGSSGQAPMPDGDSSGKQDHPVRRAAVDDFATYERFSRADWAGLGAAGANNRRTRPRKDATPVPVSTMTSPAR